MNSWRPRRKFLGRRGLEPVAAPSLRPQGRAGRVQVFRDFDLRAQFTGRAHSQSPTGGAQAGRLRDLVVRPTRYADRCIGACGRAYVREEVFDAQVEVLLNSLRFDAEVAAWLTSALKESCAEEKRLRDERSARLRQEHDRLQARIEQAYLDKLDGRIDAVLFDRMAGEWRAAQERCRLQIADFLSANAAYYDDGLRLLELARSAADLWKRQTRAEKRKLLGFLVANCTLAGDQLTFELRQPFDLLREKLQMSERLAAENRADFRDFEKWLPG